MFKFLGLPIFKNYYFIIGIIYLFFNFGILDNLPFSDDNFHIFEHSFLRDNKNPLNFFNPFSEFFKSWGLTYSYFWLIFKVFGKDIVICRLFNLGLHFTNHILFRKWLKNNTDSPRVLNILGLIFLFSPLSILTTTWIFQAKTLLAFFFFLLFINYLEDPRELNLKKLTKLCLLFIASLTSKVLAILAPVYCFYFWTKKFNFKKSIFFTAPLIFLSFVYGLLNIKGITYLRSELNDLTSPITRIKKDYINPPAIEIEPEAKFKVFKEVIEGGKVYFSNNFRLDTISKRHILSVQNLGKLVLSSIGLNHYQPFYESNIKTFKSFWLYIYIFFGIGFIITIVRQKDRIGFIVLILFIPISGYFYVPYMKYSFSSDHWFYPAAAFIPLILFRLIKNSNFLYSLLLVSIINYAITLNKYNDFPQLLQENYRANKNPFILNLITQNNFQRNKTSLNASIHLFLLKNEDFNNPLHYKALLKSPTKETQKYLQKAFGRFAVDQMRLKNLKSLIGFTNKHDFLLDEKARMLIYLQGKAYQNSLDRNDYIQLKKHLND